MQVLPIAYWVHNLSPFLWKFTDTIGIRYYGLSYVLGFLVGAWLLIAYAKAGRSPLPAAKVWDLMMALMLGVYIGGRVGHFLLYDDWLRTKDDPFFIFKVWEGGMSFHGGLVGVGLATYLYARSTGIRFLNLEDLIASAAPVGLFFGRIANFINGELWGKPSDAPWAVIFPQSAPPWTPLAMIAPRHPSQLYEAALEGLLLLAIVQWRFWRTDVVSKAPGRLTGEFCVAYALFRSFCEIFREPDEGISLLFGLSRGTFYSVILLAAGLCLILRAERERRRAADR
ncbi:MAG: prolipoprotein diacylglyceryl transferase [Opitutaceae bacterium]|jgi:phosphatidylglycerol:prolipoprotein diacylglycerol transferase